MLPAVINAEAEAKVRRAQRLIEQAGEAVASLATDLSSSVQTPVKDDVKAAHRRAHRTGHPAKLAADSELRSFVTARLDTLTFDQIADEVAKHFPPERRVSRSSIHRWWLKSRRE